METAEADTEIDWDAGSQGQPQISKRGTVVKLFKRRLGARAMARSNGVSTDTELRNECNHWRAQCDLCEQVSYRGRLWFTRSAPFVSTGDVQVMLCGIDGPVSVRDLTVVRSGTADDEDE